MKKDGKKLLALSMASVLALVPMIASAAPGNSNKPVKDDVKIEKIIEDGIVTGVIQAVDEKEITVNTKTLGLARFYAGSSVKIEDENTSEIIKITDLKPGMEVEIEFDINGPVGLSEPPYYSSTKEIKVLSESIIKEEVNYLLSTGEIIEINEVVVDGKKVVSILLDNNNDGMGDMWYNLSKKVIALSDGEDIDLDEFRVGDEITAVYKDMPMILIYPGRLTPELVILNDNSINNVKVSYFDEMLVSKDNMLKLILNSDTDIEAYKNGASLKEEDIKNSYAVVIYGATTRSIPAQTLANGVVKVIVFEDDVKVPGPKPVLPIPGSPGNSGTAHSKNAVSKIAKDYGYKVKWDPKEKVVTLTKDSDVIKVFIGKDQVEKNGQLYKTSVISSLEKNRAYVSQEIINLLD